MQIANLHVGGGLRTEAEGGFGGPRLRHASYVRCCFGAIILRNSREGPYCGPNIVAAWLPTAWPYPPQRSPRCGSLSASTSAGSPTSPRSGESSRLGGSTTIPHHNAHRSMLSNDFGNWTRGDTRVWTLRLDGGLFQVVHGRDLRRERARSKRAGERAAREGSVGPPGQAGVMRPAPPRARVIRS